MNINVQKGEFRGNRLVYKLIERKSKKIETLLSSYNPDLVDLKIRMEKIEDKNLFSAKLVLTLPNQVLRAEKQANDLAEAVGSSFDTLTREVNKFKELLRKEHTYSKSKE